MRLDQYVFINFKLKSRSFAENIIKKGKVTVNGKLTVKPSYDVQATDEVLIDTADEFESLGGDKLQKALDIFNISVQGKVIADIGASNGGFTDCLLRAGASKVYAVDVADCAFSDTLKGDERVVIKDNLNARFISVDDLGEKVGFITIDVSFISLKLVLPACLKLLNDGGEAVVLIKPQFEIGKKASKSGIVLNPRDRLEIVNDVVAFCNSLGFYCCGLTTVPKNFKNKNVEYLARLSATPEKTQIISNLSYEKFLII